MAESIFEVIPEVEEDSRSANLSVFKDEEQQIMVIDYLTSELELAKSERNAREILWKTYRRQSMALPENKNKDFPWEGASNVVPPIMMSIINTITAKLVGSFAEQKPLWKVEARDDAWNEHADSLTKYLNLLAVSKNHLNIGEKKRQMFYDLCRLGDQVVHMPWVFKQQKFRVETEEGVTEEVVKTIQDSPGLIALKIEDFFIRGHFENIQNAPWIARRNRVYYHDLLQKASQGIYSNVELLTSDVKTIDDENYAAELRDRGITIDSENVKESTEFEIFEAYVFWDIDGNGVPEDIVVTFEPTTKTILRTEYNKLGVRPFDNISYIKLPHMFYSMGVGDITSQMQGEAETLHNMDIDGRHLAMLGMKAARRDSGIDETTELKPGKIILIDDVADIKDFEFPDVSQGAMAAEQRAQQYAREASGAPAQLGGLDQSEGNRIGATGTKFLAAQADGILDAVRDNISQSFSRLGMILVTQLVANKDRVDYSMVSPYDEEKLRQIFSLNIHELATTFKLNVSTTELSETEAAKRQGMMQLYEVYTAFGQEILQYAQVLAQGGLPEGLTDALGSLYVGKVKMMRGMFENFNIDDIEDYLPYVRNLELMLKQLDTQKDEQLGVDSSGDRKNAEGLGGLGVQTGSQGSAVAGSVQASV